MAHPTDMDRTGEGQPASMGGRSLGELFADLSKETGELVREEVVLAKAEMSHKAAEVGKDVGFLAAGGAVLYAGFLALLATAIIALAYALPWWLAALIVGIVVLVIGGFLVWKGMNNLKRTSLAPAQTIDTLKEDATWAKDQI